MFNFRFLSNGNYELISIDGIKKGVGQHWAFSLGDVIESEPINKYSLPDGVTVTFLLVTTM